LRIRQPTLAPQTQAGALPRCSHTLPYARSSRRSPGKGGVRQRTSAYVSIRQLTSAYVSLRQHTLLPHTALCALFHALAWKSQSTSAYVSIRQHASAYVAPTHCLMRAHLEKSAYVSIRTHYVSIRQHTSAYVAPTHNLTRAFPGARLARSSSGVSVCTFVLVKQVK
jgi:hypothetical protein